MNRNKIIVRPESENLWWGIYGFCEKTGWEDLNLFDENEKRIGGVCLNGKGYLRAGLDDLKNDPEEKEFVLAIEKYLADNKCHYWYYYDEKENEDLYEVPYLASKNNKGVKPRFMDIWHPDEGIGISTIDSAIKILAKEHLGITDCVVEIQNEGSFEDSLKSFKENEELFGGESKVEVKFTDELIEELSQHWKKPKDEVLKQLENSIK
ncbi:hypothetical protein [Fulvivirga sediminis]|uniref:Uncharacterized protein n=1 Tax=Fulvivirga sediminis TaxID=2803949 RepID=A0A937K338_9BACT|nr:hypothetical protein [Fulvivirga sediminis]MBL3659005.1 hypothetical protein [Fulvivirga sediminis]